MDPSKRFLPEFGIYKVENNKKFKIYEPPLEMSLVKSLFNDVLIKAENDTDIVSMVHTHIMFEKVHPFVDGNGRIGRLILQRSMSRLMNFANVLPLSHALCHDIGAYYNSFDIQNNKDIDKGVQAILNIIPWMYQNTKGFLLDLKSFIEKISEVIATSNKLSDRMAKDIMLAIQTKSTYIHREYGLNVKTIDSIFEKLNGGNLPFNRKIVGGLVTFWNMELEEIIDHWYK